MSLTRDEVPLMQPDVEFDVVALGETMIRYSPVGYRRFEQSQSVEMHVGGSESNTAVGLSRLGHNVAWLSRLTRNPLARLIASGIAAHGVNVDHIVWTDQDRVGTYYMERGQTPRESSVLYDRSQSAASRMRYEDFQDSIDRINAPPRVFHTTGITLGLAAEARKTAISMAEWAKQSGSKISFDVNYRGKLWSCKDAKEACESFAQLADYLFLPLRDAKTVFDIEQREPLDVLKHLHELWPKATVFLTLGSDGAAAVDPNGATCQLPAIATVEVERLGRGDAFSAGCLSALLNGYSLDRVLQFGNAAAAVKATIPGDLPIWEPELINQLLEPVAGEVASEISRKHGTWR